MGDHTAQGVDLLTMDQGQGLVVQIMEHQDHHQGHHQDQVQVRVDHHRDQDPYRIIQVQVDHLIIQVHLKQTMAHQASQQVLEIRVAKQ